MKRFFIFSLIFLFGFLAGNIITEISNTINPEFLTIRILDNQKCENRQDVIEMDDRIVSIKPEAIDTENHPVARYAEAFFRIVPMPSLKEEYSYRVHAQYSDCADIISDKRTVERGWILYESISEGEIKHVVRSR